MNIRKRVCSLAAAVLVAATAAVTLGVSTPAWAGSDPNGGGPAPIVAPAGFETLYKVEQNFVYRTCGTNNPAAVIAYGRIEAAVDGRLIAEHLPASPPWDLWINSDANNGCPKG